MSTNRRGKQRRTKKNVEIEKSQEESGSSSISGRGKKDKRFGKRKLTAEQLAEWREKTAKKMKSSAKVTLKKELPEVLVSVLEEAHDGSCQHAKFLLEVAGPEVLHDKKQAAKNQSLVQMLLDRIG